MSAPNLEWERYHTQLADGGSRYAETNLEHFVVEPWNAFSSLLFLIPAFYWAFKIRHQVKNNSFIAYCVPLLAIGGLGSTLFHAFRSSSLLLLMDVLPILVLTLSVSAFFVQKLTNKWWQTFLIVLTGFALRRIVVDTDIFSFHTAANVSYAISGVSIFLPMLLVLIRTGFQKAGIILASIILFALALLCREIDAREINFLPMGTHFLWHLFCAAGAFYIAKYLYILPSLEAKEMSADLVEEMVLAKIQKSS